MTKPLALHEGVIRPDLIAELESYHAPDRRVSSYYLDVDLRRWKTAEAARVAVKSALAKHREQIEQLDATPAVRHALRGDWEMVQTLALQVVGQRGTRSLACFVASENDWARALSVPWPVRNRAFFEDRFVLWPLRLILEQADRYAVCLTDKEKARLFLFYLEQIEEVAAVIDEVPGRVRIPDVLRQRQYMHKHVEHFHHHFDKTAEAALRLFERTPFEHLIIGGRRETLPQFESHLHRYLRDRVVARWEIDVRTTTPSIQERVQQEEQQLLQRQAEDVWNTIQEQRPQRGALGPDEVFRALFQRRVQALLTADVEGAGFRCSVCGRLALSAGPCVECGGKTTEVPNVHEEAVHEAVEQSATVRSWRNPVLNEVHFLAALKRF